MLKHRFITAFVSLPGLLWILIWGPRWSVAMLFGVCTFLTLRELLLLMMPFIHQKLKVDVEPTTTSNNSVETLWEQKLMVACTITIGIGLLFAYSSLPKNLLPITMASCFFGGLLIDIFLSRTNAKGVGNTLTGTFSLVYGVLPWCAMWELYDMGESSVYLLFLLVIVWGGDTGGYFGGRFFGKHKLMPRISPKKTMEGAAVGLIVSLLGALSIAWYTQWSLGSPALIVGMALVCGIIAQMGDLLESALKRVVGVKDSSQLLPGHGGFLDRVDGLLMAAPFLALWFRLLSTGP